MISLCLTSLFTKQLLMHYLRRLRHHKCSSMYCFAYKTASLVHQSWNRFKTRSCFFLKNNFLFNCSFQTQSMAFKRTFFLYPFCSHSIPTFAKDRPFLNRINFSGLIFIIIYRLALGWANEILDYRPLARTTDWTEGFIKKAYHTTKGGGPPLHKLMKSKKKNPLRQYMTHTSSYA